MMSRDHPLAREKGSFLPLSKLVGQPLFIPNRRSRADSLRTWFGELGEEPCIAGDLSNYIDAVALSEQNAGICIYPELVREFLNFVRDCREEERRGTQPYRMPEEEFLPPADTKYL